MAQRETYATHSYLSNADLLVLLAALLWGVTFYFQKDAMSHVGPLLFNGLRGFIAAIVLLPLVAWERKRSAASDKSVLRHGVVGGLVFLTAGMLQQTGIATATLTNTAFLTALYVVVTPFLNWLLRGDRPAIHAWCCAALSFCGIWLLGGGTIGMFSVGDQLVAASSVFWSLLIVVTSSAGQMGKPFQYTLVQFVTVAIVAIPLALMLEPTEPGAVASALPSMLFVGAVGSALTYAIMTIAARHASASRAAILLTTEVLVASALGYFLLGERLSPIQMTGAAAVFCAVVLVQLGRPKNPVPS